MKHHVCFLSMVILLASLGAGRDASAGRYGFTGNKPCLECHEEIYSSWEKSAHAKVFDLLKPGVRAKGKKEAGLDPKVDYRKDSSCMHCHVTGWTEGGYSMDDKGDQWKGIGCEICHGPAGKWMGLHSRKKLKRRARKLKQAGMIQPFKSNNVCARCHYNANSPFRLRDPNRERDWTDPKLAETYHVLR